MVELNLQPLSFPWRQWELSGETESSSSRKAGSIGNQPLSLGVV